MTYIYKRNRTPLRRSLDWRVRAMMQLCLDDLSRSGMDHRLHVVLQTGRSKTQSRYFGLCYYFWNQPTIYVYTYRRRMRAVLMTLAHECGHVAHFVLYPQSQLWMTAHKELFADRYARLMMERFEARYGELA